MDNKNIEYYLDIAAQDRSLPEETADNWAEWVARPVVTHNLAPRQARAALELIGTLADLGVNVSDILGLLATVPRLTITGVNGAKAGKALKKIFKEKRIPKND